MGAMAKRKRVKRAGEKAPRVARLAVRVSQEQIEAWEAAAADDDRALSDWVRLTLDKAAGRSKR